MDQLAQHIESIVFVSESPINFKEIKSCLEETFETKFKKPALEKAIDELKAKYQEEHFSFEFLEIAGGFQFLTKPAYHNSVGTLLRQNNKRRLSKAALETLSIIAYKQPVVKSEMEKIRGVSCDYSVQKLLEKELIMMVGRSEAPGRPLLYGTSEKFMDYFGLKNLEDMPKPKDFKDPNNEIGEQAPIDESVASTPIAEAIAESQPTANEEIVEVEKIEKAVMPTEEQIQSEGTETVIEEEVALQNKNRITEDTQTTKVDNQVDSLSEEAEDYEKLDLSSEEITSDDDSE